MPQHVVAIDIGARRIRLLVLETTFRRARVLLAHTAERDPALEQGGSLWTSLRRLLPAQVDAVICNADAAAVSTRLLSFPFEDQRKVEAALGFEIESQTPHNLDETALTWNVGARGGGRTDVLTATAPRAPLAEQLERLSAVGLEPRTMVLPAAVLGELLPDLPDEPVAILSLGETQSHLAVVHGTVRFARTIRAGGLNIDRSLARRYNLPADKARLAKETEARVLLGDGAGDENERAVSAAVLEGLGALWRAMTQSLHALPAELQPRRLYLTGGPSRMVGLTELLESRLHIPVQLIDLRQSLGEIGCRPASLGPEYADALAMLLAALRRGRAVPLNFRRGPLAYRGDLQVYRGEMVRVGVGLSIVLLLAIGGSFLRYSLVSAEERRINQAFCEASKRIVGREVCDPTAVLAIVRGGAPSTANGIVVPSYSATALFEMLSRVIAPEVDVTFEDVELRVTGRVEDPDKISAKGEAATFETTDEIVTRLKQHPCVQEAEVSKQRKKGARVEFNLSAKVVCPAGVLPSDAVKAPVAAADAGAAPESVAEEEN